MVMTSQSVSKVLVGWPKELVKQHQSPRSMTLQHESQFPLAPSMKMLFTLSSRDQVLNTKNQILVQVAEVFAIHMIHIILKYYEATTQYWERVSKDIR